LTETHINYEVHCLGSRFTIIDGYAADSSRALAEQAQGEAKLQMYESAGHGTNMFNAEPELTTLIADWLAAHWE